MKVKGNKMSIWKTPGQKPTSDNDIVCMVGDLPFVGHYDNDYQAYLEHASGDCYAVDEIDRWAYLSDIIPAADRAERLQKAVDLALWWLEQVATPAKCDDDLCREFTKRKIDEIKQLIKGE